MNLRRLVRRVGNAITGGGAAADDAAREMASHLRLLENEYLREEAPE